MESKVGVDKTVKWPTGTGAKGNDGVAACVKQQHGAVGYVEQAYALQNNFTTAAVKNKCGKFVAPTLASTTAAGEGIKIPADLGFSIIDAPSPKAYPIASRRSCSSTRTCARPGSRQGTAKAVKAWLDYALGDGQKVLAQLQYGPLPAALLTQGEGRGEQPAVQRSRARWAELGDGGSIRSRSAAAARDLGRLPLARYGDRALRWGLTGLAAAILAADRLLLRPACRRVAAGVRPEGVFGFTFTNNWDASSLQTYFGALPLLVGTLITSAIALLIGVPVAVATALYVTELCPRRLRGPLTMMVELLAAVPSVVYGLWGVFVLAPKLRPPSSGSRARSLPPLRRRRQRGRTELLHRRADPRDHDPADRLRDLARGDGDGAGASTRRPRSRWARRAGR